MKNKRCLTTWRVPTSRLPWVKHDAAGGARGLLFTSSRNVGGAVEGRGGGGGGGGGGGEVVKQCSWIEFHCSAFEETRRLTLPPGKCHAEPPHLSSRRALWTASDLHSTYCFGFSSGAAGPAAAVVSALCSPHRLLKSSGSSGVNKPVKPGRVWRWTRSLDAFRASQPHWRDAMSVFKMEM